MAVHVTVVVNGAIIFYRLWKANAVASDRLPMASARCPIIAARVYLTIYPRVRARRANRDVEI